MSFLKTPDTSHLMALIQRLDNERQRLETARTESEVQFRTAAIAGVKREIAAEYAFLGMSPSVDLQGTSDDDLLSSLKN